MQAFVCGMLLLILVAAGEVVRGCPGPCSCPLTPPSCLVGVSLVLDVCGCCKVCAQQFNQDCGPDKPCDHIKGLRCHLGAGGDPQRGLCRGEKTQHMDMFLSILFPIPYIHVPRKSLSHSYFSFGTRIRFQTTVRSQKKKFLKSSSDT
ncbi:hypothetical protein AMELA_G00285150 [Ameiurus melas]|uniref:IGFBP N-terminal domain-containing protein n=1 Tax=Ameiurus melas TaxID=219545 RepID=A0A7J5ZIW7_AMEME|nr:hypothetical protein AMELA_G00285150 [Ameiurus melas]